MAIDEDDAMLMVQARLEEQMRNLYIARNKETFSLLFISGVNKGKHVLRKSLRPERNFEISMPGS